jgi:hypothetical protein
MGFFRPHGRLRRSSSFINIPSSEGSSSNVTCKARHLFLTSFTHFAMIPPPKRTGSLTLRKPLIRAGQTLAPKTLNEYLASARSLFNWMVKHGRIDRNPLTQVQKVQSNGKQLRPRRAFTREEFQRLLAVAGQRKALYLTAVFTGLRRGELSDMRLTSKTYTDAGLLPVWDNVANLPSFTDPRVKDSQIDSQDSQIDSQNSVRTSPSLSIPVKEVTKLREVETADRQQPTSYLSVPVTTSQEKGNWSGRQDSNLRPRGPKPRALPS